MRIGSLGGWFFKAPLAYTTYLEALSGGGERAASHVMIELARRGRVIKLAEGSLVVARERLRVPRGRVVFGDFGEGYYAHVQNLPDERFLWPACKEEGMLK